MPNSELEQEIQELFRYLGIGSTTVEGNKYRAPVEGTIVSRHHPGVPTPTHEKGHFGVDLGAPKGTPVYAIGPGIVIKIYTEKTNPKGGNSVITAHEDGQVNSYYAHLDTVNVGIGEQVNQNTKIGTVGTSGMIYNGKKRITAPHLHWQVKIKRHDINPLSIKEKPVGQLAAAHKAKVLTRAAREVRLSLLCRLMNQK